jgi:hypothetical protein
VAVSPPARGIHVSPDTPIWAQFATALDPRTVNVLNVFLKVDTRRLPIDVSYDAASQRIQITPLVALQLVRTHTVELSPRIQAADGTPLGATFGWQFTLIGIRSPRAPFPSDSTVDEFWNGTETTAGTIIYDIYAGTDSSLVSHHLLPAIGHPIDMNYLPTARWAQGASIYWQVHTRNTTTGESSDGPLWTFATLPASTPIDSVFVPARDWFFGATTGGSRYIARCNPDSIPSGNGADNYLRWNFSSLSPGTRLAGARMEASPLSYWASALPRGANLVGLKSTGGGCPPGGTFGVPFPIPIGSTVLSFGTVIPGDRILFSSDSLTAHLEASIRHTGFTGYEFNSRLRIAYIPPSYPPPNPVPTLKLYIYRPTSPALARRSGP